MSIVIRPANYNDSTQVITPTFTAKIYGKWEVSRISSLGPSPAFEGYLYGIEDLDALDAGANKLCAVDNTGTLIFFGRVKAGTDLGFTTLSSCVDMYALAMYLYKHSEEIEILYLKDPAVVSNQPVATVTKEGAWDIL